MRILLFFLFLLVVTTTSLAQRTGRNVSIVMQPDQTILPFTYRSGANPVILLSINGKGPFKFMFDTGSPGLLKLDQRTFERLGLSVTDSVSAGDGSGLNNRSFPVTIVKELRAGNITLTDLPAMIRNYNGRQGIDSIDGVIGPDFFNHFLVELNFENNQLVISKGKLDKTNESIFPLVISEGGVYGIKGKIGEHKTTIIFDTGNMGGLTLPSSFMNNNDMIAAPRVTGQARTISNTFDIKEVQLKSTLYLGHAAFEKPVVVMNDHLPGINAGIRLLKQLNIVFDFRNRLARITKFNNVPASSPANEYAGLYGDRNVSLGEDGNLYIRRPGGINLKMIAKGNDRYGLEIVEGAEIQFERNEKEIIIAIRTKRPGAEWERSERNK